jgi:hypothetical protein
MAGDAALEKRVERVRGFHQRLLAARLGESYESAHAKLVLDFAGVTAERRELLAADKIQRLPEPSQSAADKSYDETLAKLCDGLDSVLKSHERSPDASRQLIFQLWNHNQ